LFGEICPSWARQISLLASSSGRLFGVLGVICLGGVVQTYAQQEGSSGFVVHNLASEKDFPFEPENRGRKSRNLTGTLQAAAVEQFPDLHSCLMPRDRTLAVGDRLMPNFVAWKLFGTPIEVDVCVFRILTALDDIDEGRKWLAEQGFKVEATETVPPRRVGIRTTEGQIQTYSVSMPAREFAHLTYWSRISLGYWLARSVSGEIALTTYGKPISVNFTVNVE